MSIYFLFQFFSFIQLIYIPCNLNRIHKVPQLYRLDYRIKHDSLWTDKNVGFFLVLQALFKENEMHINIKY